MADNNKLAQQTLFTFGSKGIVMRKKFSTKTDKETGESIQLDSFSATYAVLPLESKKEGVTTLASKNPELDNAGLKALRAEAELVLHDKTQAGIDKLIAQGWTWQNVRVSASQKQVMPKLVAPRGKVTPMTDERWIAYAKANPAVLKKLKMAKTTDTKTEETTEEVEA